MFVEKIDDAGQVVVYVRISEDRTGEEAGVDRQREDCLELCARLGLEAPEIFMDNDISAFQNKRRPGYAALLEKAKLGPIRVVVWHVDRLYRKPRELEDLIDLVESHPIRIEAVKGGVFDLNTHEGRLMARQLVAIASYESGHKADRIRRANRQKAERGDWHGAAKFGYGIGGVLIPGEAVIIREMADRFLAGQSLRSITRWLNEDSGMPSPMAHRNTLGVWHATSVKSILVSARISGQRAYEPDRKTGDAPTGREILGPGRWEAIVTPEETARIRAVFASPDRRASKSSINLLSVIAVCGVCGAGLVSGRSVNGPSDAKRRYYRCMLTPGHPERGGLSVSASGLEELVSGAVIARLSQTRLPDLSDAADDRLVTGALQRILTAKERMEDIARDYGSGQLSRAEYHAARTAAQAGIEDAERVLGKMARVDTLRGIPIGDEAALRAAWEVWSIPQKRAILAALIDTLIVHPNPRNGSRFVPGRVELRFKA